MRDSYPEMRTAKDSLILAAAIMKGINVFRTGNKDFPVFDVKMPEIFTMSDFRNDTDISCKRS